MSSSELISREVLVTNRQGIHARPSALIVQTANRFRAHIEISNSAAEATANAKSMLEVMMLIATCGTRLLIQARGDDAEAALDALEQLISSGFSEG